MRTSKPIATISYNTQDFLYLKCEELIRNHVISDYMFIHHFAEADEKKDHTHVWLKPNKLIDTLDLQKEFMELDPNNPTKPFKIIDCVLSKVDEWILYTQHYEPYLASKGEKREFHYTKDDFLYHDEDTFEDLYNHAFRGSEWAKRYQILEQLNSGEINPADLIANGTVPLNLASQVNAFYYMKRNYVKLDRGGRPGHDDQGEWIEKKHDKVEKKS